VKPLLSKILETWFVNWPTASSMKSSGYQQMTTFQQKLMSFEPEQKLLVSTKHDSPWGN
jgi:hypothetical protein